MNSACDSEIGAGPRWRPVILIGAATAVVETAVYVGARGVGASNRGAVLATLTVALVWTALATPLLAAGARRGFDMLLRGGVIPDTTALVLVGLWLACPQMSFISAAKVYLIVVSMALAGIAAVGCLRSAKGRLIAGMIVSGVLILALATPFWGNGLLIALDGSSRQAAATGLVAVNPVFSLAAATARDLRLVWNEAPIMYRLTVFGQTVPVPVVRWYVTPLAWLAVASMAGLVALLRRRGATLAGPAGRPAAP